MITISFAVIFWIVGGFLGHIVANLDSLLIEERKKTHGKDLPVFYKYARNVIIVLAIASISFLINFSVLQVFVNLYCAMSVFWLFHTLSINKLRNKSPMYINPKATYFPDNLLSKAAPQTRLYIMLINIFISSVLVGVFVGKF